MTDIIARAQATLRANDRGGYTVPTARLYPFQWNWDSAFVAMGFSTFDQPRAWREIERLLEGQWADGLIPHIVFHAPSDDYFPGPDVWGTAQTPPTSGITQPPVLATAARLLVDTAIDGAEAEARMAAIFPALHRNHRWWERARDPHRCGLVATLHPWESGMDNSPSWDRAMARVPTDTATPVRRRDTAHVDAAMRPHAEDYQRFIHLVDVFRTAAWDPARMFSASPFRMADPGTNAILLRAELDLAALAQRFGTPADIAEIARRIGRLRSGLATLWNERAGLWTARDLVDGTPAETGTSAGLLPLYAHAATPAQARRAAATLAGWADSTRFLVPSTDPSAEQFEPLRYWRGPVWAVVNWMIAGGLDWAGQRALAARVRADTIALIDAGGLMEYFDPTTGAGAGGADFSWTAAIRLLLAP
jgi:glycogen debranching enzyme